MYELSRRRSRQPGCSQQPACQPFHGLATGLRILRDF